MSLTASILSIVAKLLAGSSVRWVDCQPDACQRVYFANHTSHLDALIVWSSLPPDVRDLTRPVAAKAGPASANNVRLAEAKVVDYQGALMERFEPEGSRAHGVRSVERFSFDRIAVWLNPAPQVRCSR